jgi:hypothetical protein
MQNMSILRISLVTGCVLLVPLLGNIFMGWNWPAFAFPVWGALLFGTGLFYEMVARRGGTTRTELLPALRARRGSFCSG